jgi:hypothetical protein
MFCEISMSWQHLYPLISGIACLGGLALLASNGSHFSIARPSYYRFLFQRWKLVTFFLAAALMATVAPYTGDPTWDGPDALLMSALTYWTAPWSIGTLARLPRFRVGVRQAYVAICLWLLSASLSYDIYLWIRTGAYPDTSQLNLVASSGLYIAAGLFWNLEYRDHRAVHLAFLDTDWPRVARPCPFRRIWPYAALVAIFVAMLLSPFFWHALTLLLSE